jgi:hypothetical protein
MNLPDGRVMTYATHSMGSETLAANDPAAIQIHPARIGWAGPLALTTPHTGESQR